VVFDGPERLVGQVVPVDIIDASPYTLYGRVKTAEIPAEQLTPREPAAAAPRRVGLAVV
jgi:hypothetical protein